MTINEAIEILEKERKNHHSFPTDIIGKAEGLGIEALKARQADREHGYVDLDDLLPGETED